MAIEEDLYFAYRKETKHINGKMYFVTTLIEISDEDLTNKYADDETIEVVRQLASSEPLN